jgi:predicted PurR-regulated permease PerM
MPLLLLFISLLGGFTVFGAWGAILGPLVVRLAMEALAVRKEAQTNTAHSVKATTTA